MGASSLKAVRVRVFEKGDARTDGILRMIEEAGRPRPLHEVLAGLCRSIAQIGRADVVSVYLRETDPDGDVLVMRANVGFPSGAVGTVRLRPGEGLTGIVAECLRPVTVAVGPDDQRYKHVPGLGEEHYPAYLGVPLLAGGAAAGVLVLQRREARAFPPAEVALATALAAPVVYAIERGRMRAVENEADRAAVTTRTARLAGAGVTDGHALGRAELLPSLEEMGGRGLAHPGDAVGLAFAAVARELERTRRRVESTLPPDIVRQTRALGWVLEDRVLRDLAIAECARHGVAAGMRLVAREYARAAYRLGEDGAQSEWHVERAAEIEDLCFLVAARALGVRTINAGSVIVAERLTGFLALAMISRRAEAAALAGRGPDALLPVGVAIARSSGLPVVAEIAGLFAWTRPGDRLLVESETGVVRVNPPETAVARFKHKTRNPQP